MSKDFGVFDQLSEECLVQRLWLLNTCPGMGSILVLAVHVSRGLEQYFTQVHELLIESTRKV